MIGIIDYGLGNLYSIRRSLDYLGIECEVTRDMDALKKADRLILPGVGAFRDAIALLDETGLTQLIRERAASGTPLMGICLGMQLLFTKSYEYGEYRGLDLIPGEIRPLSEDMTRPLKVPQIGWNALDIRREHPISSAIRQGDSVYYVHSYYAKCEDRYILADSEYDVRVPGIVNHKNVCGCQFHPEKSGNVGLKILRAFAEWEGEA